MTTSAGPLIIDVEASGFGPLSYPIEVGLALSAGEKYCSLILPAADWTHYCELLGSDMFYFCGCELPGLTCFGCCDLPG